MTRVVVVGDLMTDTVAHAALPLARGSDTPAMVTMHGGGSGANIAAWLAVDGAEVAFVGRRGADIAGRNRDMELMGYGVDARLVMDPERPTGTCVVMVTHKGDHTMLSDPGANAALSPDDLPKDLFTPGSHLHVSGYTLLNTGSRQAMLAALDAAQRRHDDLGRRRLVRAARARRRRAVPAAHQRRDAAVRERRAGQGADRPGRPGAGGKGAERVVPARGHEAGRGRRAVVRQRPPGPDPGAAARRWRSSSTGPARATRSAPGSCRPGWTRSRRPRRWSAGAAWRRGH